MVKQCIIIQVAWIKQNSRKIISLHGELVTQSARYAIYKKNEDSVNLVVTDVKMEDAGTYICQINSNPMVNLVCIETKLKMVQMQMQDYKSNFFVKVGISYFLLQFLPSAYGVALRFNVTFGDYGHA